jgi:HAD superfamily hydrolase (TIGR01509 family)
MLRKPVEAAIFDMDGLLIDTEAVYFEAYHAAAQAIGTKMPMELCHAMIGVPTRECEAMIQDHFGPEFSVEQFHVHFNEHARLMLDAHVPVKPGAGELLAWLGGRGLPLAIATSSRPTTVQRHLGRAGLLGHFKAVATRYDVERGKPHPDVYLEAARRLDVAPQRCIAFEDSRPYRRPCRRHHGDHGARYRAALARGSRQMPESRARPARGTDAATRASVARVRRSSCSSGPRASGSLKLMSEPEARGPEEHERWTMGYTRSIWRRPKMP